MAADPCAGVQSVTIDTSSTWSCRLSTKPEQFHLVRAEQKNVDVVLEVVGKSGSKTAVDAPSRRTSPELLLIDQSLAGEYIVQVRSVDRERAAGTVAVAIDEVRTTSGGPLLNGLRALTQAANIGAGNSKHATEQRIAQLRAAAGFFRTASARALQAEALIRIAGLYYFFLDDYENSASTAKEALDAFALVNDASMSSRAAVLRAAALLEIANAMRQATRHGTRTEQSQFDESVELLQGAAREFRSGRLVYDEAQAINFLGIAHYYQGDYAAARAQYIDAARLFRAVRAETSAALPLQNIAMIDYDAGDYARAIASYDSLLQVIRPADSALQYVAVLLNMGTALYAMGDFDGALRAFMQALSLCEQKAFATEQARSLHGLGIVYLAIGERERATIFLERALVLRRSLADSDPRGLQTTLLRVGDLKREGGAQRAALNLHLEALDRALSVMQKARALHAIGLDHEANKSLPAAMQAYETALQLEVPRDAPVGMALVGAYGRARLRSGDEGGRALVLRAAHLQEASGNQDLAAAEYLVLSQADTRSGRLDSALANVQKTLSLYDSQRLRTITPDLRATYVANRAEAFELQSELLMRLAESADNSQEKQRYQHRALLAYDAKRHRMLEDFRDLAGSAVGRKNNAGAARELAELDAQIAAKRHRLATIMDQPSPSPGQMEQLRQDISLLRTRLDLAQATASRNLDDPKNTREQSKTVRDIQNGLEPETALLAYQLAADRSWLWYVTRTSASVFQLSGRSEIQRAARDLYATWSTPVPSRIEPARALAASKAILGSTFDTLHEKRRLIVVPDGDLKSIPFGALFVGSKSGKPHRLAISHAIAYRPTVAPGRTEMPSRGPDIQSAKRILLVGDPTSAATSTAVPELLTDPWAWQPLPGSRREIESIEQIASGWHSYVLMGAQATKPALLNLPLDTFHTIHFATHARLDVLDPQLSSIALSSRDASFGSSNATLSVREIVGLKLEAESVVLSACEASLGKDYRGQLSFGLSEAFLLAGARNVLGSLWRVSDDAAQAYMRNFYRQYVQNDAEPAVAAQAAARELARQPQFSHPFFWAPFVVTQQ